MSLPSTEGFLAMFEDNDAADGSDYSNSQGCARNSLAEFQGKPAANGSNYPNLKHARGIPF